MSYDKVNELTPYIEYNIIFYDFYFCILKSSHNSLNIQVSNAKTQDSTKYYRPKTF